MHLSSHFVPNISVGPQVLKDLKKRVGPSYFDCHLMVTDPLKWLEAFQKAGADSITFHYEAVKEGN